MIATDMMDGDLGMPGDADAAMRKREMRQLMAMQQELEEIRNRNNEEEQALRQKGTLGEAASVVPAARSPSQFADTAQIGMHAALAVSKWRNKKKAAESEEQEPVAELPPIEWAALAMRTKTPPAVPSSHGRYPLSPSPEGGRTGFSESALSWEASRRGDGGASHSMCLVIGSSLKLFPHCSLAQELLRALCKWTYHGFPSSTLHSTRHQRARQA